MGISQSSGVGEGVGGDFEGAPGEASGGVGPAKTLTNRSLLLACFLPAMINRLSSDVVLVHVLDQAHLADVRKDFDKSVRTFPEFYHPEEPGVKYPYVPGSFGAFRNPSNYHCLFARIIRTGIYGHAAAAIGEKDKYFTQLFDSMSLRRAGSEYKGESWHRDSNPIPGKIWQGWINFDDEPQHFRCVFDSALKTGQGFGKEQEPPLHLQRTVEIPPGFMILFRQDILHCILKSKKSFDSYRQYVAFRISDSPDVIYDAVDIMQKQSTPPCPSGERPKVIPSMWVSALRYSHYIPWSECIVKDLVKEPIIVDGQEALVCPQYIRKGLVELGVPYPAYMEGQMLLMQPRLVNHHLN